MELSNEFNNNVDFSLKEIKKEKEKFNQKFKEALTTTIQVMEHLPMPFWVKKVNNFTYSFVNKKFKEIFSKKGDPIGRTMIEFWGNDIGATYKEYDLKVLKSSNTIHNYVDLEIDDEVHRWKVIRFPIFCKSGHLVYLGGFTYIMDDNILEKGDCQCS